MVLMGYNFELSCSLMVDINGNNPYQVYKIEVGQSPCFSVLLLNVVGKTELGKSTDRLRCDLSWSHQNIHSLIFELF